VTDKPITITIPHTLLADADIFESFCENERDLPPSRSREAEGGEHQAAHAASCAIGFVLVCACCLSASTPACARRDRSSLRRFLESILEAALRRTPRA
jgi:hypothetical protein